MNTMTTFRLNMQIICDELLHQYKTVSFYSRMDSPVLEDVRLFRETHPLQHKYLYLLQADVLPNISAAAFCGMHLMIVGAVEPSQLPTNCTILVVEDAANPAELFTLIQDIFEKYHTWNQKLFQALNSPTPLDDMLNASLPVFQNPIFIHDPNFYILSCPHVAEGMSVWETEPSTGMSIAPLSLIHDFRADVEYLETLQTRTPSLFSANLRGYPILYYNLWNQDSYIGRICVDELETALLPGQYLALQYLGDLIVTSILSTKLLRFRMDNDLIQFFTSFLDGNPQDQFRITNCLTLLNWNRYDRYLVLRLENVQLDVQMRSAAATLGYIDNQIPDGFSFFYQNGITVIVNVSRSDMKISDILRSFAFLLREGLMKMGSSSELPDFMLLPQGFFQAKTVLDLGRNSQSMNWYYRFDDYIPEYLLKKGSEFLTPELMCSSKLLTLRKYDETSHTDLYHTLKVFLELERNALQTAKALFIHRSTLFYRLERIQKIADVNLDDPRERLVLRISFFILDQEGE